MQLCIPFLALDIEQYNPTWRERGFGAEASLFDRKHVLDPEAWETAKRNVREVAKNARPSSFIFHFPVNECNYVQDQQIEDRLLDALDMVGELGLDGMVLHSNQVRDIDTWLGLDLERERAAYWQYVDQLRQRIKGAPFWVGLENMPIMGNLADEYDPVLVFPSDFAPIGRGGPSASSGGNLGITWDFCHYSYTVHVVEQLRKGTLDEESLYVSLSDEGYFDFLGLRDHIVHYHFSAFAGVASQKSGTSCREGVAPWQSTVSEEIYAHAIAEIAKHPNCTVTLEISERDYRNRELVYEVAEWCQRQAARGSEQ